VRVKTKITTPSTNVENGAQKKAVKSSSSDSRLKKLKSLLDRGLISEEDAKLKRREILKDL
jgi:hypothetical protein